MPQVEQAFSTVIILNQMLQKLAFASQDAQQEPWPPPPRCSQQSVQSRQTKVSPDIVKNFLEKTSALPPGLHPMRSTLIPYGLEDMDWNGKVKTQGRQRGSIITELTTTFMKFGCQPAEMTFKMGSDLIGLAFQANSGNAGKAEWCGERLDAISLNFPPDTTVIALFCKHMMKFQNSVFINGGGKCLRIDLTLSQFNKALLCRIAIAHM